MAFGRLGLGGFGRFGGVAGAGTGAGPGGGSGPTLDLNFAAGTLTSGAFTDYLSCTRASTGYAQTVAGTLTSFGTNTLRRTDKGLLVEEARTNLQLRSQEFDNASWSLSNLTITANAVAAPDGTTTADKITDTSGTAWRRFYAQVVPSAGAVTLFIYAKAGTRSGWFKITASSQLFWANFNASTGTLGLKHASVTDHRIDTLADGWYRCSFSYTHVSGLSGIELNLMDADDTGTAATSTGDGTGTLHVWGAQFEAGDYPTSYIPTTTASVTRAADAVTLIGTADTIIDGTAASAVASMGALAKTTEVDIVAAAAAKLLYKTATTSVSHTNGSVVLSKTGLTSHASAAAKYGSAWTKAGGRSVTGQGAAVATDANTTPSLATIYLGTLDGSTLAIDGYVSQLELWNSRLSDADLVTETT